MRPADNNNNSNNNYNSYENNNYSNKNLPTVSSAAARGLPPMEKRSAFNPRAGRYRVAADCCHVRNFTLAAGAGEIFLVFYLLVSVAPDLHTKLCADNYADDNNNNNNYNNISFMTTVEQPNALSVEQPMEFEAQIRQQQQILLKQQLLLKQQSTQKMEVLRQQQQIQQQQRRRWETTTELPIILTTMLQSTTTTTTTKTTSTTTTTMTTLSNENTDFPTLRRYGCVLDGFWLAGAIIQIAATGLMCYGVRRLRYYLMIPHILIRVCCLLASAAAVASLAVCFLAAPTTRLGVLFIVVVALGVSQLYLIKQELRCCEFICRSALTGFSVSRARPIEPTSVLLSDTLNAAGIMVGRPAAGLSLPPAALERPVAVRTIRQAPYVQNDTVLPGQVIDATMGPMNGAAAVEAPQPPAGAAIRPLPPLRHTFRPR